MKASLYRLLLVHSRLDAELRREHTRQFPDSLRLLRLRKLIRAVKDRMHRLAYPQRIRAA